MSPDLALNVERVTGIEPALSAWEPHGGVVLTEPGAGRGGPVWPGLPHLVPHMWPVDGPAGHRIAKIVHPVGWCLS